MRKIYSLLLALLCSISTFAQGWNVEPKANDSAIVTSGNARFTVLTPEMIRIQYSKTAQFEDRSTFGIVNRNLPVPNFTTHTDNGYSHITTSKLTLRYKIGQTISMLAKTPDVLGITMHLNGRDIVWYPGKEDAMNLNGTTRTLDGTGGDEARANLEKGIISRGGWSIINESPSYVRGDGSRSFAIEKNADGFPWWATPVDKDAIDLYFLGYGHGYKKALGDFVKVAGRIPLPPKYVFGYWYSRYWTYTSDDFKNLVTEMKENDIPLDVMIMDTNWHLDGWTGYTWNTRLIPDPEGLIRWIHRNKVKVALNLHPHEGIQNYEDYYDDMKKDLGYDDSYNEAIPWKIEDYSFAKAFFKNIIRRREYQGVDFWWIDWQQWATTKDVDGLGETFWINHTFFNDMIKNRSDRRPVIFHRWGGLGSHRYPIGFSGDAHTSWSTMTFEPYFTSTASNVGFGYWGHDLGGHNQDPDNNPERYQRWMQFGVFSPIFRTHATNDTKIERRIWKYPNFKQLRETVRLRYAMFPYIYTAAREAYDTGISMSRPLYYDFPESDNAYTFEDEYMFGDNILVSPITTPAGTDSLSEQRTWLPKGVWFDVAKNRLLNGNVTFTDKYTLDQYPYFFKAGSVIVNYPKQNTVQTTPDTIIVKCVPGGNGTGSFYEDNGNDQKYVTDFARTSFTYQSGENSSTLTIGGREGSFAKMPTKRVYRVEILATETEPTSVTVDGKPVEYAYDSNTRSATVIVPMEDISKQKIIAVQAKFMDPITLQDEKKHVVVVSEDNPKLWITGTAVPNGTQPLEVYPNNIMKFHGTLKSGSLYIINTNGIKDGTVFYAPRYPDSNIISSGIPYRTTTTTDNAAWAVDASADNYRFSVDTNDKKVSGELYTSFIDLYIGGGCVAAGQSSKWSTDCFIAMQRSAEDKDVWTWTGELKSYSGNVEPKALKFMAQKAWSPIGLHPYTSEELLTSSEKLCTNGSNDYKWNIGQDGWYKITIDAFRERIRADYLGKDKPTGIGKVTVTPLNIKAIYSVNGTRQNSLEPGINIVTFTDGKVSKVMIK